MAVSIKAINHSITNNAARIITTTLIGGLAVSLTTWILSSKFHLWLFASAFVSVLVAIDICYLLNNHWALLVSIPIRLVRTVKYFLLHYRELIKFAIVGGFGAICNFTLLYILTNIGGVNYLLAAAVSALFTTLVNYTINHYWTFQKAHIRGSWFNGWLRYKLIDDCTIIIYLGQLALFVQVFGLWYMFGAVLATIINYPIRYFIIKKAIWDIKKHNQREPSYEWDAYYNGGLMQMWWKRSIANIVWKWIPNNGKLLDIGCGSSPIVCHYDNAIGVDQNDDKLEFMRAKSPKTLFTNGEVSNYVDNSFDYVICIEVIEHLSNPALMVKEISRVLKNGGKVVIATPDYSKPLWRMVEYFTPYKEEHHNNFTMDKLDRLCEKYNLMPTIYKYVAGCDLVEMFIKGENANV